MEPGSMISESAAVWADNHCHISKEEAQIQVAQADEAGVKRLICIGTDLESSDASAEIAERFESVWATAGVHPHEADHFQKPSQLEALEGILAKPKVVAVGECGLDFYYDHSDREVQKQVFRAQIRLAQKLNKALVIHTREAWEETFEILDSEGLPDSTIFHCFTGGLKEAEKILELGAYISFSGIITFKSAEDLRSAAQICPVSSVLVETDAPFLAPEPVRGKTNFPANLVYVGKKLAEVMGVDLEVLARRTWENTARAYGLAPGEDA